MLSLFSDSAMVLDLVTTFAIREGEAPAEPRETLDTEWQSGSAGASPSLNRVALGGSRLTRGTAYSAPSECDWQNTTKEGCQPMSEAAWDSVRAVSFSPFRPRPERR